MPYTLRARCSARRRWRFSLSASQVHTEAGTFGYMAPEQAYGRPRLSSDFAGPSCSMNEHFGD